MRLRSSALFLNAVLGDPSARPLAGWLPFVGSVGLIAAYVGVSLAWPASGLPISFAIVPIVGAALVLAPLPAALTLAACAATVVASRFLPAGAAGLANLEVLHLATFGAAGVAIRAAVLRGARDRGRLASQSVALSAAEADAAIARQEAAAAVDANERWVRQLEVVQRAAARMTGRPSIRAVAEAIVEETRAIVEYDDCRVYLIEGEDLIPITAAGRSPGYDTIKLDELQARVGEGFAGWVALHGVPLLVPDASLDSRGVDIPGTDPFDESMVVAPMRYEDRVTGVIALARRGLAQFDDAHLRLLMILADHAATALESTRQLMRAQELADELRRIVDMSAALSQSLDPHRVAGVIARHMAGAFGVDECAISHYDRGGDRLATWGYWPDRHDRDVNDLHSLADFPATRRVLDARIPLDVDIANPAADPAEVAILRRDGFQGLVMFPLVAKGESIGLVELLARRPFAFDERRRELARAMANEAAMALANAHLYETARGLADRDPLTGFFNHRYLQERLAEEIVRAQRSRDPLAILMIDLDDFKLVNDTLGHLFGDEVLAWVAEQIRSALRLPDVAARFGGDEFVIILPATNAAGAREVGDRILAALDQAAFRAPHRGPVPVGASIGVAVFPLDGVTGRALLGAADARLYRVKRNGGGAIEARVGRRHLARPTPRPLTVINEDKGGAGPALTAEAG
jgi:diguanylate cyclase (GGDEF)-like protein